MAKSVGKVDGEIQVRADADMYRPYQSYSVS